MLQAFEEAGFQWQNMAGTSAGAITAALAAVGYTASELKTVMDTRVDFRKFMDPAGIGRLPYVGPWLSMLVTRGMYQGDYFLELMRQLLSEKVGKENVTFRDRIVKIPTGKYTTTGFGLSQEDREWLFRADMMLPGHSLRNGRWRIRRTAEATGPIAAKPASETA